jgi:nitronate monooxygenase
LQETRKLLGYGILCCFQKRHYLSAASLPFSKALLAKLEKHALRVSLVIAAVAKVSCEHGLWLVARVNFRALEFPGLRNRAHLEEHPRRGGSHWIVHLSKRRIHMLPNLKIGNLTAKYPIIQGGMGVGISLSSLAGAVAKAGGIGVISAAQPGWRDPEFARDPLSANLRALAFHIRRAKEISNGGIIGVNIMCALTHYEEYVRCCIENGADLIISGAGLPTDLPKYTAGSSIKLAPIVSPPRTAKVLLKLWDNHYHRVPDLVVIEGPAAGGHLGYSAETVEETARRGYDDEIREILQIVHGYEEKYACTIPVVFAGGVYTHEDILHYLSLGCAGVQMATRFVVTEECDADPRYKQAYLNAKKEDITIMHSPVGMPGRAIRNPFLTEREQEREKISHCYQCLKKCDKASIPYCITTALTRAADGDTDNALLFCGENAWRLDHMTTVPELMAELAGEYLPDSKK